jgi:trimethylamine:corrinoid methyltransferase-like protein
MRLDIVAAKQTYRRPRLRHEVGPAGHFFGAGHTMARCEHAFNAPLVSNWDN